MRDVRGGALALGLLLGAATAAAEPAGKLTAYVVGEPATALSSLRSGVGDTFASDGRIVYRPLGELMPEVVVDAAAELKLADADLDAGDQAFSGMDIEPAKQHLNAAVERYRAFLPELVTRDHGNGHLKSAWMLLAKVAFFDGDAANAKAALRHVLTLDPQMQFNKAEFPPQMKKVVQEARAQYDAAGKGRVVVTTQPAGAIIYVDGEARP